jgi:hypothetical protein
VRETKKNQDWGATGTNHTRAGADWTKNITAALLWPVEGETNEWTSDPNTKARDSKSRKARTTLDWSGEQVDALADDQVENKITGGIKSAAETSRRDTESVRDPAARFRRQWTRRKLKPENCWPLEIKITLIQSIRENKQHKNMMPKGDFFYWTQAKFIQSI